MFMWHSLEVEAEDNVIAEINREAVMDGEVKTHQLLGLWYNTNPISLVGWSRTERTESESKSKEQKISGVHKTLEGKLLRKRGVANTGEREDIRKTGVAMMSLSGVISLADSILEFGVHEGMEKPPTQPTPSHWVATTLLEHFGPIFVHTALTPQTPIQQYLLTTCQKQSESDFGKDDWDPHASTKPSPLDGEASDEHWDPKDNVDDTASEVFNLCLVQMLVDLQDNDPQDDKWKPVYKQKKMRTKAV
ncbi:hypothetical protein EI94DRAFT_1709187 [Lactarius quietus]|nr:hypothetical protein EI94DRAFT_1709187 [Lactarius quietus]